MKRRLINKVRAIMADSQPHGSFSVAGILQCAARLFGAGLRLRALCYRTGLFKTHRLPCTVISIGNITSGGTGKTPMTLYTARLLRRHGHRVVILSRGYKGGAEKGGGIVSDGRELLMTPGAAGDEPYMMARFLKDVPVLVGRDRVASGRLAVARFSPDILLLDDGFQHRRLHRDIDIVLLDSAKPFGNGFLLPRGSLRELPDALSRADAILFTRCHEDLPDPATLLPKSVRNRPVFRSRNAPYIYHPADSFSGSFLASGTNRTADLKSTRIFAFSAIAENTDFHRVLTQMGCHITGTMGFADHHAYSIRDLEIISRKASSTDAELLVTTQKDLYKLPRSVRLPVPLVILGVLPSFFEGENGFGDFLKKAVTETSQARRDY